VPDDGNGAVGIGPDTLSDGQIVMAEPALTLGLPATLAAPWARDSNGREVETRYELDGTDILQVVDHRETAVAYPVVADPGVDLDPGWVTLKATYSRDITNRVASLVVGAVGAAAAISASRCPVPPS
jgi:hypothetical protein